MRSFNAVHERFKYNGEHYHFKTLKTLALKLIKSEAIYKKDIGNFLLLWQDYSKIITLKTSGSTGAPKNIKIKKEAMVNSAIVTGKYFNLKPGDHALLCLPAHYIAGKMMLVRALVLGLEIDSIEPKSNLQIDIEKHYHFTAMVPLQLEKSLSKLQSVKTVIVGGAKVSTSLNAKLQELKANVFETYGMTETVSHIAVKQLNNNNNNNTEFESFKTLPNIEISQDERQCLIIKALHLTEKAIITNDVVEILSKNEFQWLGRVDNIINSGGIKVFPEQVENRLSSKISNRFFIASEKDKTLGERVILIIEGVETNLDASVFKDLGTYYKPKKTYFLSKFVDTNSGKIQRKKTLELLKK